MPPLVLFTCVENTVKPGVVVVVAAKFPPLLIVNGVVDDEISFELWFRFCCNFLLDPAPDALLPARPAFPLFRMPPGSIC